MLILMLVGGFDLAHQSYVRSVLQGALNDAARRAAVEDPAFIAAGDTLEKRVANLIIGQVEPLTPDAEIVIEQSNFYDFSGIGNPEKLMTDVDENGQYDESDGDCFADLDEDGEYDTDTGRTAIDEANVYEVFAGAGVIGDPLDFEANGRIVLSSLQDNEQTGSGAGQMINWQRCWGELDVDPAYGTEGTGREDDALEDGMGAEGARILSAPDTAVMVVEVSYSYQPLIGGDLLPIGSTIRHESAFNVRGRQNNDISNTQSLAVLACD